MRRRRLLTWVVPTTSALLILLLAASCRHTTDSDVKITGGEPVTRSEDPAADAIARATVRITSPNAETCSGTLITRRIVVTAAHCVVRSDFDARVYPDAEYAIEFPLFTGHVQNINWISNVIIHPEYVNPDNGGLVTNDIALIRLDEDAPAEYEPALILTRDAEIRSIDGDARSIQSRGQRVLVAGYGRLTASQPFKDFQMTEMELYAIDDHKGILGFSDDDSGVCRGDSGGPAYVHDAAGLVLAGISSMATCDKTWEITVNQRAETVALFALYSTDIRKFADWVTSHLDETERRNLRATSITYSPMTTVRSDQHTLGILQYLKDSF